MGHIEVSQIAGLKRHRHPVHACCRTFLGTRDSGRNNIGYGCRGCANGATMTTEPKKGHHASLRSPRRCRRDRRRAIAQADVMFDPETIAVLSAALDAAWERLLRSESECTRPAYARPMREVIARRII